MVATGSSLVLCLTTLGVSLVAGLVPFVHIEVYLLAVSAVAPRSSPTSLALAAALGQMAAKALLYLGCRGTHPFRRGQEPSGLEVLRGRYPTSGAGNLAVILASASLGLPPFYAISLLAGALGWRFDRFLALGFLGRFLRFEAVLLLPRVLPW